VVKRRFSSWLWDGIRPSDHMSDKIATRHATCVVSGFFLPAKFLVHLEISMTASYDPCSSTARQSFLQPETLKKF